MRPLHRDAGRAGADRRPLRRARAGGARRDARAASTSARPRPCSRSWRRSTSRREARGLRWGLVPPWARALRAGPGADQRALRDAARQAPVRAAGRARPAPLPRRRRRLVRVAAARAPEGRRGSRSATRSTAASCSRSPGCGTSATSTASTIASVTILTTTRERGLRARPRPHAVRARRAWRRRRPGSRPTSTPTRALELLGAAGGRAHRRRAREPRREPRRRRGSRAAHRPGRHRPGAAAARLNAMSTTADDLVGREAALAALTRALDTVAAGGPGFLAVVGEPGIGKTSVMERLRALAAERDWLVLAGRAAEFERELPVRRARRRARRPPRRRSTSAGSSGSAGSGSPSWRRSSPRSTGRPSATARSWPSATARTARSRSCSTGSRSPGRSCSCSTTCTGPTTRRSRSSPRCCGARPAGRCCSPARSGRAPAPGFLESALATAEREGRAERVDLGPLTVDDAAALLREIPEPSVRDAVFRVSGGNPFYLSQLARLAIRQPVARGDLRGRRHA